MPEETQSRSKSPTSINPKVMDYLRIWHERMAHANLKAIVVLGRQGATGKTPEGLPKGPEDDFEASGLFINRTNSAAHSLPHDIGPPRQAFSNDITMVDALPLEAVEGVGVTFVPI
ncbi:hypothetical protein F4824DRAFT_506177 [Ustulina deusta]|nr:hypothetical protein F4824DRAFT_506177 [Ustulina deusta]